MVKCIYLVSLDKQNWLNDYLSEKEGSNASEGVDLPLRVRASWGRASTSFLCALFIGCHWEVWYRFEVGLPTSNDPLKKNSTQVYPAFCMTVNLRCQIPNEIALFFLIKGTLFCTDLIMSLLLWTMTWNSNIVTKRFMFFTPLETGWWDTSKDKLILCTCSP